MSLFVVNRYEDTEWKKEENDSSHAHLAKLLEKIEERKRQREIEEAKNLETKNEEASKAETQVKDTETSESVPPKRKKKKGVKRKLESVENLEEKSNETNVDKIKQAVEDLEAAKESFTILGAQKRTKIKEVKRFLPRWLTNPNIVSYDLKSGPPLEDVETTMCPKLIEKLKEDGFNKLFPVQGQIFSWLLKCDQDYQAGKWVRDTCVSMPTGSGKTLAYTLPIIHLLQNNFVRLVRCLVVLPVQELAAQVYDVFSRYASNSSIKIALISGASSFKEEQEKLVQKTDNGDYLSKVDVVIATPGRLIDHIKKTTGFSLTTLRFLVIDEADRSTEWIQYIPFPHQKPPPLTIKNIRSLSNVPAQKLLLSATLSQDPEKLSRLGLFQPILFTSAIVDFEKLDKDLNLDENMGKISSKYGNPSELTERIVECDIQFKPIAVYQLIIDTDKKTLVFTNSSESAHRLAILLKSFLSEKNISVNELSAQLGTKQREQTLEKFRQGKVQVLVSSDALARGLDIAGIKLVISYDLPKHIKGYIHRAGRTGRGGVSGTAISILQPSQTALFTRMMQKVGKIVPSIEKEDFSEIAESINYESHLENLKNSLSREQETINLRFKSKKRLKIKR